jgi:hypothetical protein
MTNYRLCAAVNPYLHREGINCTFNKITNSYHIDLNRKVKSRRFVRILNILFNFSSPGDKSKTNLDLASLVWSLLSSGYRQKDINSIFATLSVGNANVTVVNFLISVLGGECGKEVFELWKYDAQYWRMGNSWASYWKAVSVAARRTSHWENGDKMSLAQITGIAGLELAIGRDVNKTDWEQEIKNRTTGAWKLVNPFTGEEIYKDLAIELDKMFSQLGIIGMPEKSWPDFVRERQNWSSSGSTGGKKWTIDNERVRLNKHAYFETITGAEMSKWLGEEEPKIQASASDKFENGKARAIYGTDIIDYSITSYLINDVEKKLSKIDGIENGLRGGDEVASIYRRKRISSERRVEATMLDYKDFNLQHTLQAQAEVFLALKRKLERENSHSDQIKAAEWLAQASLNQWAKFPDGVNRRLDQGMFSGHRATNFLNTVLNVGYFEVYRKYVKQSLGLESRGLYHIHQGDDVWITNNSRLWAIGLYNTMAAGGFEFQASKQIFDVGRGEFLRVVYTDGEARGYLNRAIVAMVIKPIQSIDENTAQAKARGLYSSICTMYRRGLDLRMCDVLWEALIPWALRVKAEGVAVVPRVLTSIASENGGLGLPKLGKMQQYVKDRRSKRITMQIPAMIVDQREMARNMPSEMTNDWLLSVDKRVQGAYDRKAVRDSVHVENMKDSITVRDRQRAMVNYVDEVKDWNRKMTIVESEDTHSDRVMKRGWFESGLRQMVDVAVKSALDNKFIFKRYSQYDAVTLLFSLTPFKDIDTARMALKLGVVDAIKWAVTMARESEIRSVVAAYIPKLESLRDKGTLDILVDGFKSDMIRYEWYLSPIVLSWVSKWALGRAMTEFMVYSASTTDEAKEIFRKWMDNALDYTLYDHRLCTISFY